MNHGGNHGGGIVGGGIKGGTLEEPLRRNHGGSIMGGSRGRNHEESLQNHMGRNHEEELWRMHLGSICGSIRKYREI